MLQSELASEVGITTRHLMSLENSNRKPSYDLLYKLIRTLGISADAIFYPEREEHGFTPESVRTLIQNMNEKDMGIVIEAMKLLFTRGS
jgi:transcriptional regulator with XRE-family HTH domain